MSKTASSTGSRRFYLWIAVIIGIALGIALVEWRPFAASDQDSNVAVDAAESPLVERWRTPIVDATQWVTFGNTFVVADSVGLTAVDLGSGEIIWQLPGITELGWVSADGYVLANGPSVEDPHGGSFTQTYSWISPVGQVLWSATSQGYGPAVAPPSFAGLRLYFPLASSSGFLVLSQYSPDGQFVGIAGVAPDGQIAWTSALPPDSFYRRDPDLALGSGLAADVYELPTTVTRDVTQGDGGGFAAYDVETGQSLRTFDVGTFYTSDSVLAAEVFTWRDRVVWQTAGSSAAACVLHGMDAVTGATWQSDVRCLEGNNMLGNGWLAGGSLDPGGSLEVQMIDLETGHAHQDDWSGDSQVTFHLTDSVLSVLTEDSSMVSAHALEDGTVIWDLAIPSTSPINLSLHGDTVAVWFGRGDADVGDAQFNTVSSVDAKTGEIRGNYALPSGEILHVLPLSSSSFLVLRPDYVGIYESE